MLEVFDFARKVAALYERAAAGATGTERNWWQGQSTRSARSASRNWRCATARHWWMTCWRASFLTHARGFHRSDGDAAGGCSNTQTGTVFLDGSEPRLRWRCKAKLLRVIQNREIPEEWVRRNAADQRAMLRRRIVVGAEVLAGRCVAEDHSSTG